ncbi:MAG TPA: AraC family transcriptional regulator [Flavobacteriales bacterium]|nr:AraC family transcriptional regulator [Flavobacteriales bacterium]HRW90933.1 AraC family transcriptional regulator [Flavobacteriales bacterium]
MKDRTHTLTIRNMVCDRCKAAVTRVLQEQGLPVERVELGEVELDHEPSTDELDRLQAALQQEGFELVLDHDVQVITKVKAEVVRRVHHEAEGRLDLAALVRDTVHRELSSVSKLFSEGEGMTLEHFFLLQRLERVKELIRYGELTFSEIAFATGFSSAAHLSAQFKQLTGMTPTAFRDMAHPPRKPLDQVR